MKAVRLYLAPVFVLVGGLAALAIIASDIGAGSSSGRVGSPHAPLVKRRPIGKTKRATSSVKPPSSHAPPSCPPRKTARRPCAGGWTQAAS